MYAAKPHVCYLDPMYAAKPHVCYLDPMYAAKPHVCCLDPMYAAKLHVCYLDPMYATKPPVCCLDPMYAAKPHVCYLDPIYAAKAKCYDSVELNIISYSLLCYCMLFSFECPPVVTVSCSRVAYIAVVRVSLVHVVSMQCREDYHRGFSRQEDKNLNDTNVFFLVCSMHDNKYSHIRLY